MFYLAYIIILQFLDRILLIMTFNCALLQTLLFFYVNFFYLFIYLSASLIVICLFVCILYMSLPFLIRQLLLWTVCPYVGQRGASRSLSPLLHDESGYNKMKYHPSCSSYGVGSAFLSFCVSLCLFSLSFFLPL